MCRFVLFLSLLVIGLSGSGRAEWDWRNVRSQGFTPTDKYVIAVGTKEKREVVRASDIKKALLADKEVRLKYVEVKGSVECHDEKKQAVYFIETIFSEEVDFSYAKFFKKVSFDFTQFAGKISFIGARFLEETTFFGCHFSKQADFSRVRFSEQVNFDYTQFTRKVSFTSARFFEKTSFFRGHFSKRADFSRVRFSEQVSFSGVQFLEDIDFKNCAFKGESDFTACLFPRNGKMIFSGVTDFPQMQIKWVDERQNQRGLKECLEYDETFYTALIKNYQGLGWLDETGDCYYTYRKERRKRLPHRLHRLAELAFLEFPFGYGVKPFKLLRSFLILWIPFSVLYACFLRLKEGELPRRNWTSHDSYALLWATIYSLNLILPGIHLVQQRDSFIGGDDLERKTSYVFPYDSEWIIWAQRKYLEGKEFVVSHVADFNG